MDGSDFGPSASPTTLKTFTVIQLSSVAFAQVTIVAVSMLTFSNRREIVQNGETCTKVCVVTIGLRLSERVGNCFRLMFTDVMRSALAFWWRTLRVKRSFLTHNYPESTQHVVVVFSCKERKGMSQGRPLMHPSSPMLEPGNAQNREPAAALLTDHSEESAGHCCL